MTISPQNLRALVEVERERRRRQARGAPPSMHWRGGNAEAQRITAPAWVLSGPAETGKTWATLWRLDSEARKWPGSQWALIRKVRVTIAPTVLRTYLRIQALYPEGERATPYGGNNPVWFDYPNGARVWIGGMDDPGKVLSGERDGIYINQAEELDEDDYETLTTRATGRGAVTDTPMVWGDCNPGPGDHWIVRRRDAGALVLLESRHEDNPTLHDGRGWTEQGRRSLAALDALTGVRYQRLRLGRWVGAEGQFFTEWDEARHVRRLEGRPSDWPVWGALDYGFAHPLAFGLFTAGDGAVYLLDEHVRARWLIPQHAGAILEVCARHGVDPRRLRIVAGHDAWATRGGDDQETIADKFARHGLRLERATISRVNGAQALLTRLGNAAAGVAPSLFIDPRCAATIAALPRMVADPRDAEDVLKVDADAEGRGGDDAYDMLRYGVMAAPSEPVTPVRTRRVENRWRI